MIAWMVTAGACDRSASRHAPSGAQPTVNDAGVTPDARAGTSDAGAPIVDAAFDMRVPPARDTGAPVPPAPTRDSARDAAAVDAPDPGAATIDAATKTVVPADAAAAGAHTGAPSAVEATHVFVVTMENQSAADIYGSADAPYINTTLLPASASASAFTDELPNMPSEPHYIWMEAGTNAFSDHTFVTDDSPSAANSTASAQHLVAQIRAAGRGLDWMSYQEGIGTGECPVTGSGVYVPRHDPTLFFQDVAGDPPSRDNAFCASHHRPLSALANDVASGAVASYVFITPSLCHNMHGSPSCPTDANIRAGDDWLSSALPPLIAYVNAHGGVVFVTWDEGSPLPFIAVGPHVKAGYRSAVAFQHGSMLKTVEEILQLPILPSVENVSDLSDLFANRAMP